MQKDIFCIWIFANANLKKEAIIKNRGAKSNIAQGAQKAGFGTANHTKNA